MLEKGSERVNKKELRLGEKWSRYGKEKGKERVKTGEKRGMKR